MENTTLSVPPLKILYGAYLAIEACLLPIISNSQVITSIYHFECILTPKSTQCIIHASVMYTLVNTDIQNTY